MSKTQGGVFCPGGHVALPWADLSRPFRTWDDDDAWDVTELSVVRAAFREKVLAAPSAEPQGLTQFQWTWALEVVLLGRIACLPFGFPLGKTLSLQGIMTIQ